MHSGDGPLVSVSGAYIFGCSGLNLGIAEKTFFRETDPFGFILFARNLETPGQIRTLCTQLREAVGRHAPIFIDQEGGRVARLRSPFWRDWLPALEQMETSQPDRAVRGMWIRYRLIAAELQDLGIDGNCAPILDVPTPDVHAIIRNRCYGTSAEVVAKAGRAVAEGLLAGGVLPVVKHIPGHGRPRADSHVELPRTDASREMLQNVDFAPFYALRDAPIGMTAHVVYSALDPDNCATLSGEVIRLIRQKIGFEGLLMTDDLSMSALTGSFTSRTERALQAGNDVILHCNGNMAEMAEIAQSAQKMSQKAALRAERALSRRVSGKKCDEKALLAELDDLLS